MQNLPSSAPEVFSEFEVGNFVVKRAHGARKAHVRQPGRGRRRWAYTSLGIWGLGGGRSNINLVDIPYSYQYGGYSKFNI